MKLVCIGDSLTYGYGVPSNACWVELLKIHLNIEVINKGINGDTTAGILSRSYRDIIEQNPAYVIIMAGTNDIIMDYPLKLVKDNIELLVKEVKENNIIPILALQPPIVTALAKTFWDEEIDYEKANENLLNYINWAKIYADEKNIALVNFYDSFMKEQNINNLYCDGIHLNASGHKLMFEIISDLFSK